MREATVHLPDGSLDAFGMASFVATVRDATVEDITELQCGRPGCLLVVTVAEAVDEDRLSGLETVEWWERLQSGEGVTYLCEVAVPALGDGLDPDHETAVAEHELAVTDDGIDVTVVGPQEDLAERIGAYEASGARVVLRSLGEYGGPTDPLTGLTSRQREVLTAAVEQGFFAVPREVTTDDLAADLGLSPATVREHLQRAQRTVFTALVDTGEQ